MKATLVAMVSALAFLLASFPARNSDIWLHLAAGRELAHNQAFLDAQGLGGLGFHAEETWLYDLLSYALYSALGGAGLVFAKALVAVALAVVLIRLSPLGPASWLAAACTALALVAMGPRLLLEPATVSYFLLALTLWLAWRRDHAAVGPMRLLRLWPLAVVFVIWTNLDPWFTLGLATLGLTWLGHGLDAPADRSRVLLHHALGLLLLAAVCLVNPRHVHAFTALPELLASSSSARVPASASPFGWSPAGLAYWVLLGLGLFSFVVNISAWRWHRFLPWLGLGVLSALHGAAIPFFAVVTAPTLAWNLQESLARRRQGVPRQGVPLSAPRPWLPHAWALVVVSMALLVCAWPGWLGVPPYEPRQWAIEIAPSLERGAAAVQRWHQDGKLRPQARGLFLTDHAAHAFAWFCPEERGVLDRAVVSALRGAPDAAPDWAESMRQAGIDHVIVYHPDAARLLPVLHKVLANPKQWPLLHLEGELAIFGWRDPSRPAAADPFRAWALDLHRLAFQPSEDKRAPAQRPPREPEPRHWWHAFWKAAPLWALDRDEAVLYWVQAEALRSLAPLRVLSFGAQTQPVALVGAAAGWSSACALLDAPLGAVVVRPLVDKAGAPLAALMRAALGSQRLFNFQADETPPALLYLGIRAARRALALNPDDPRAYFVLGDCYVRLLSTTRERAWQERFLELVQLRRTQAVAALNQALSLKPDIAQAHLSLAALYADMRYLDLELKHHRAYFDLIVRAGPPPGVSAQDFREHTEASKQQIDRLAELVAEGEKAYAAEASRLRVYDRAVLALTHRLAGKALDVLLDSDVSAFGRDGMAMELELLLATGRIREVREWARVEHRAALGPSNYHWLRARALAAAGDYASAREEFTLLARGDRGPEDPSPRDLMTLAVAEWVLDEQPALRSLPRVRSWMELRSRVQLLAQRLRLEADANVLGGLIALEEGDIAEAMVLFRLALAFWRDQASAASGAGVDFGGRIVAESYLRLLE